MEAKLPINAAFELTPDPFRRMRRLFEDYRTLQLLVSDHEGDSDIEILWLLYINHKTDNYDSISAKKRDIGTLNMFLFYIIFTNDFP